MKIGFNLLMFSGTDKQGGADIFFFNVLNSISNLNQDKSYEIYIFTGKEGSCRYIFPNINTITVPIRIKNKLFRILFEQTVFLRYIKKYQINVLVSNYVSPIFSSTKKITVIHDLIYMRYPQFLNKFKLYYWSLFIPFSLFRSEKIITVSKASMLDIHRFFPKTAAKVEIITEGVNIELLQDNKNEKSTIEQILQYKFILSAATFMPNKNIPNLVKAFKLVRDRFPEVKLVLTGKNSYALESIKELIYNNDLKDSVILTGFISNDDLIKLYKQCELYVMPSFFEGFGLSILEAQLFEAPVVCSNMSSLPEVAGIGANYFDPYNVNSISDAIINVLESHSIREKLKKEGLKNIKRYSWDTSAKKLIALIES